MVANDGRVVVGKLLGFDQVSNLVLSECVERIFRADAGVDVVSLGVFVLRGDNVAAVGEMDEAVDGTIKWNEIVVRLCIVAVLLSCCDDDGCTFY